MELSEIFLWVLETRGEIQNFCVGVRDPGSYPEFLCGCKRPGELFQNFFVGVRDTWSYPNFLCGCKRLVEISEISVWV